MAQTRTPGDFWFTILFDAQGVYQGIHLTWEQVFLHPYNQDSPLMFR